MMRVLLLLPLAPLVARLINMLADRLCPEGFECQCCGFVRGDDLDREIHMLLAHGQHERVPR